MQMPISKEQDLQRWPRIPLEEPPSRDMKRLAGVIGVVRGSHGNRLAR